MPRKPGFDSLSIFKAQSCPVKMAVISGGSGPGRKPTGSESEIQRTQQLPTENGLEEVREKLMLDTRQQPRLIHKHL